VRSEECGVRAILLKNAGNNLKGERTRGIQSSVVIT